MEANELNLLQLISQVSAAGLFGGIVWYMITKALPEQQKRSDATLEKMANQFCAEQAESRKAFAECSEAQRASCKEELANITVIFEKQIDRLLGRVGNGPGVEGK